MCKQARIEIIVGALMLLGLLAFAFMAFKVSGLTMNSTRSHFQVEAFFNDVGGLKPRAKVTLAGVPVGRVVSVDLDEQWFEARVILALDSRLTNLLSEDTAAAIQTAGLLGDNYISLTPGVEEARLQAGGVIRDTQSALILEQLINQFIGRSLGD